MNRTLSGQISTLDSATAKRKEEGEMGSICEGAPSSVEESTESFGEAVVPFWGYSRVTRSGRKPQVALQRHCRHPPGFSQRHFYRLQHFVVMVTFVDSATLSKHTVQAGFSRPHELC